MIEIASTPEQRERCYAIRRIVFVGEQHCPPDEEFDGRDELPTTIHLLVTRDGEDLGTARILGEGPGVCHIGRVAVMRNARGTGAGRELMDGACELALQQCGHEVDGAREVRIDLSAQVQAAGFYAKCGFHDLGKEHYLDAGIEHTDMQRTLREEEPEARSAQG